MNLAKTLVNCLASLILAVAAIGPAGAPVFAADLPGSAVNSGIGSHSLNWAGYTATVGLYTSVSGTWTIPAIGGSNGTSASVVWVGIGGVNSNDLLQAGTQAVTDAVGQTSYQAWYEALPQNSTLLPLTVNPGDAVAVSIAKQADGQWLVSFNDISSGKNYQTEVAYNSTGSSAEWIVEAPAIQNSFTALNNFGTVNFTNCSAVVNGNSVTIAQSGASAVTMVNDNQQALAAPSAVGSDGESFSVTRTNASSALSRISTGGGQIGRMRRSNNLGRSLNMGRRFGSRSSRLKNFRIRIGR